MALRRAPDSCRLDPFVDRTGQGVVLAASPSRQVESLQTDLRNRLLAIGLLSFVLSAIFAALGSHVITGRLRTVVRRLKAHGEDHEEELPDLHRTPEDLEGLTASGGSACWLKRTISSIHSLASEIALGRSFRRWTLA